MMKYVNCEQYAKEILDEVKQKKYDKYFAIISVGNDPASQSYIKGKIKDCEYCGITYIHKRFSEDTPQIDVANALWQMQSNRDISSIILQMPIPKEYDEHYLLNIIPYWKDVDGFRQDSKFKPCTPEGIVYLLKKELGDLTGKTALIIGRGKLVGKPLFDMLLEENCTVTMAHSKTKDLESLTQRGFDIIVCAVGKPKFLNLRLCDAKIVVDVGVNRDENGKLCGDCWAFTDNGKDDMLVTPVPKGIGLMTRAMLIKHIQEASKEIRM
jgi:methylenetetrahydrofolate dehydrogenase (NADP+)/methenyltetrahydrofolate cyclohydrolase